VATITITLPDDELARLRQHAEASGRSLDDVIREAISVYPSPNGAASPAVEPPEDFAARRRRQYVPPDMTDAEANELMAATSPAQRREIVRAWLIGRGATVTRPAKTLPDPEWQARVKASLARIHASLPDDGMTPDEIEALITEASEEARAERIAKRERDGG